MNARRRPPYGAQVAAILRDPRRLAEFSGCTATRGSVWIATGRDAWEFQRERPNHLIVVLPDDADPASFDWRFLRGHEPILLTGEAIEDTHRRRQIAAALFQYGVVSVLAGRVLMKAQSAVSAAA